MKRGKSGKKRFIKYIAVAAVCTFLLVPSSALASGNIAYTTWSLYCTYGGQGFITVDPRAKLNTSEVHIKCTTQTNTSGAGDAYFLGTAYGSSTANGTYTNMGYTVGGTTLYAKTYTVRNGTDTEMENYIYQAGGRYVRIHYYTSYGSVQFGGIWRPDVE